MLENERNIVLTGFMGTGKSTVGPLIAQRLKREFIEMDHEIEQRADQTIAQIFEQYGEAAFRNLETQLVQELCKKQNLVIATGGGTLVSHENRLIMVQSSFVVCLTTMPEVIENRLARSSGRPLAKNWQALWKVRQAAYEQIPYQIDITDKRPQVIAQEVIGLWQQIK